MGFGDKPGVQATAAGPFLAAPGPAYRNQPQWGADASLAPSQPAPREAPPAHPSCGQTPDASQQQPPPTWPSSTQRKQQLQLHAQPSWDSNYIAPAHHPPSGNQPQWGDSTAAAPPARREDDTGVARLPESASLSSSSYHDDRNRQLPQRAAPAWDATYATPPRAARQQPQWVAAPATDAAQEGRQPTTNEAHWEPTGKAGHGSTYHDPRVADNKPLPSFNDFQAESAVQQDHSEVRRGTTPPPPPPPPNEPPTLPLTESSEVQRRREDSWDIPNSDARALFATAPFDQPTETATAPYGQPREEPVSPWSSAAAAPTTSATSPGVTHPRSPVVSPPPSAFEVQRPPNSPLPQGAAEPAADREARPPAGATLAAPEQQRAPPSAVPHAGVATKKEAIEAGTAFPAPIDDGMKPSPAPQRQHRVVQDIPSGGLIATAPYGQPREGPVSPWSSAAAAPTTSAASPGVTHPRSPVVPPPPSAFEAQRPPNSPLPQGAAEPAADREARPPAGATLAAPEQQRAPPSAVPHEGVATKKEAIEAGTTFPAPIDDGMKPSPAPQRQHRVVQDIPSGGLIAPAPYGQPREGPVSPWSSAAAAPTTSAAPPGITHPRSPAAPPPAALEAQRPPGAWNPLYQPPPRPPPNAAGRPPLPQWQLPPVTAPAPSREAHTPAVPPRAATPSVALPHESTVKPVPTPAMTEKQPSEALMAFPVLSDDGKAVNARLSPTTRRRCEEMARDAPPGMMVVVRAKRKRHNIFARMCCGRPDQALECEPKYVHKPDNASVTSTASMAASHG